MLITHIHMIIDSFAGGGGASTGIERALGRSPDVAINHSAKVWLATKTCSSVLSEAGSRSNRDSQACGEREACRKLCR